jgi:glycosyltransferase involved in cell wall biosynthesis
MEHIMPHPMKENRPYPLITLGIPLYNAADLIERTLLSVLNQSYPNIEYLFVDDKGNSMDVVRRVIDAHPRREQVRIIDHIYNKGVGSSRNTLLDEASGDYFFTMDCDDVITPDCIETLYKAMQEEPVDFVAASFVRRDMEGKEYPGFQYTDTLIQPKEHAVVRYRYEQGHEMFVAAWNKLYSMEFLRKHHIRCQEGHLNEDPWFTYQVIINARSCRLLSQRTLFYTYNPRSVSGLSDSEGYSERIARQFAEIEELKCDYISELRSESFYPALLQDIMKMSLYFAYRVQSSTRIPKQERKYILIELISPVMTTPEKPLQNATRTYRWLWFFFDLPLPVRLFTVRFIVAIRLKKLIHRWWHF